MEYAVSLDPDVLTLTVTEVSSRVCNKMASLPPTEVSTIAVNCTEGATKIVIVYPLGKSIPVIVE
jgi:hypothetical protein